MSSGSETDIVVLLFAVILVMAMIAAAFLRRTAFPPLVGFIALGFGLKAADVYLGLMNEFGYALIEFMGKLGLVVLLFRVGLESNFHRLLGQLRRASVVWLSNVLVTGIFSYLTCFYLFGFGLPTSLIIATALTATSVGVSVKVWQDAGALHSPDSDLLLDVAELDDIFVVMAMALLFAVLSDLNRSREISFHPEHVLEAAALLGKLALFMLFLYVIFRYIEHPLSRFLRNIQSPQDFTLTIASIAFVIAAIAGVLGFSLAIGAFFAGLVFRTDPESSEIERRFYPIYELFSPFFFISIGTALDPTIMLQSIKLGFALLSVAVLTKLAANVVPVWFLRNWRSGW